MESQLDALWNQRTYELRKLRIEEESTLSEIARHFDEQRNEFLFGKQTDNMLEIRQDERTLKKRARISFKKRRQAVEAKYDPQISTLEESLGNH